MTGFMDAQSANHAARLWKAKALGGAGGFRPPAMQTSKVADTTDADVVDATASVEAHAAAPDGWEAPWENLPQVGERPALLQEVHGVPVDPGVFAWMDADPVQVAAATTRLARFVEWLCAVFEMRELPICWTQHPAIVLELWALERYARKAFSGEDDALPAAWTNQLAATRARLKIDHKPSECETEHRRSESRSALSVDARRATYRVLRGGDRPVVTWFGWPAHDDAGRDVPPAQVALTDPATTDHSADAIVRHFELFTFSADVETDREGHGHD